MVRDRLLYVSTDGETDCYMSVLMYRLLYISANVQAACYKYVGPISTDVRTVGCKY